MTANRLFVDCIHDASQLITLRDEWTALLQYSSHGDPFLSWEWIATWWHHFGSRYELVLITVREEGSLVGLAPLMVQPQRICGLYLRVLTSIGYPPPDVSGFLTLSNRCDVTRAIVDYLATNNTIWEAIQLNEFPNNIFSDEQNLKKLEAFCTIDIPTSRHWFILMNGPDWDAYHIQLPARVRKDLRRCRRRLEELGEIGFMRYTGDQFHPDHMESVFDINSRSHHPGNYRIGSQRDFHRHLGRAMQEAGWIDMSFLLLDGNPIAYQYGFVYRQRASIWRTGFDHSYRIYAPGKLLLLEYLQDSYQRGILDIDWLRGDHNYKLEWLAEPRTFYHPVIVQRKLIPHLVFVMLPRWRGRIRRFLERNTYIKALLKKSDSIQRHRNLVALDTSTLKVTETDMVEAKIGEDAPQ